MAISEEQKEEIRAKVDLAQIVSSYGYDLKHSGSDLWCCCPFHNEKTPSFKVDVSRGTYHCFGCGESGDVFSFVMRQEGLTFIDAIRKLADSVGVEIKSATSPNAKRRKRLYQLMASLAVAFNKMLKGAKGQGAEAARAYVKSRQLDADTVDKFLIGYAPADVNKVIAWASRHDYSLSDLAAAGVVKLSDTEGKPPYFYFANRLVFTIRDKNGNVVAFSGRQLVEDKKSGKYINSPETLIFKKSRNFFAYDEARKHIVKAPNREAIICEGQIDCIRLHSSGFQTAVAPLGTAFTEDHAVLLHKVADSAVLCFDDDFAGHKATIKAAQLLLAEGMPIRIISLPDGDDPDSFILKNGAEAFATLLSDKAESIVKFQIRAERAKDINKQDVNSEARVAKAMLETIAKCRDKVLRTILLKEASAELGIECAALIEDISAKVCAAEQKIKETADQLIDEPIAGRAEDISRLPDTVESAFLNFFMSQEGNAESIKYIKELIPTEIIYSPMVKRIVRAGTAPKEEGEDRLRTEIETLSDEEYQTFISSITCKEPSFDPPIPVKNRVVYFARQIWHSFLNRKLKEIPQDSADVKILSNAIKTLHSATLKGVVHLISSFPVERFTSAY